MYQKGYAHVLLLVVLLIGLAFGVYLVQQRTNIFSKAYVSAPITNFAFNNSFYLDYPQNKEQYVKVPPINAQNPSANFTVEAWIRPDLEPVEVSRRGVYSIVSKTRSRINDDGYGLRLIAEPQPDGMVILNYEFSVSTGNFNVTAYSANGTVNDDQGRPFSGFRLSPEGYKSWRHVAGVIRGGNLYIYSDGKLVAKNEFGITNFGTSSAPLEFGARLLADNTHDSFFVGELDEVRISKVARYSSNIDPLTGPFVPDSDTIGLYHLNGNFLDAGPNRNNAEGRVGTTLVGARSFVFVNSIAGIKTEVPVDPTPTTVPSGGITIPGIGPINIPPIFEPQPTPAPLVVQPTLTPKKIEACANSEGNGENGRKCKLDSYDSVKSTKEFCPNRDAYPYYYRDCSGIVVGGECPAGAHMAIVDGTKLCVRDNPTQSGCADSVGNGANGLRCNTNSYDSSKSTAQNCSNRDLYPYYYSSCTGGGVNPTPVNPSACADECYSDDLRTNIGKVNNQCNSGVSSTSHLCNTSKQGTTQVCNGRTYSCNGSYWQ